MKISSLSLYRVVEWLDKLSNKIYSNILHIYVNDFKATKPRGTDYNFKSWSNIFLRQIGNALI